MPIKSLLLAGKILVVTEADDSLISEDTRFKDLISKSPDFLVKHDPIKIFVSNESRIFGRTKMKTITSNNSVQ